MAHECDQKETLYEIKKELFGNGQKGIKERVIMLETSMNITVSTIEKMDAKIDTLLDYYSQSQGRNQYKTQIKSYNQWLIGIIIGLGIAVIGFIIQIILK